MTDYPARIMRRANTSCADLDGARFNGVRGWEDAKGIEAAVNVDRARRQTGWTAGSYIVCGLGIFHFAGI